MLTLNKAWAETIENPTATDVQTAFAEMQRQEEEQGAFWLETDREEIVLEVQKDLRLTLIICGEICRTSTCISRQQAEELFRLLLNGEDEKVRDEFECL